MKPGNLPGLPCGEGKGAKSGGVNRKMRMEMFKSMRSAGTAERIFYVPVLAKA